MVVTDHQTEGRGRLGRSWFSQPGTALQLSLILRPVLPLDVFGLVSTALGLACAEAIEELTQVPAQLKWPNDVTVEGAKLAGILVETRVAGHQVDVAVAGIGINVSPSEEWPSGVAATTIGSELLRQGRDPGVDRAELLAALLEKIESVYGSVETGRGAAEVLRRATGRSAILGDEVVVSRPDGTTVTGVATRLLPSGALEVLAGGSYLSLQVGEIEHLRPASVPIPSKRPNEAPDSSTVES
jgi:BirA family biotin operon repressor/biotin-[acetyl-CoA-carboxylase] ligase